MKVGKISIDMINTLTRKNEIIECSFCNKNKYPFLHIVSERKDIFKSKHCFICEDCLKRKMKN